MRSRNRFENRFGRDLQIKVLAQIGSALMALFISPSVQAFTTLTCTGDIDVRLLGPKTKKPKVARAFSITKKDALELELSVGGHPIGRLFPWDRVIWEESRTLAPFKDVKFKTDDATVITISLFDIAEKRSRTLDCRFSF